MDSPREFRINELFFSTTDRKGVITAGNQVFVRVGGYDEADMIGQPQNIIRHPDMPRAVFKLFWSYLQAGNPIAAYVKNMAADGRYYWVLALVAQIKGGYLSIRCKPSSAYFPVIQEVYRELRGIEHKLSDRGEDAKSCMAAAGTRLNEILKEKGFEGYDAFMRVVLHEELKSRDATLETQKIPAIPALPPRRDDHGQEDVLSDSLASIYEAGKESYEKINELYLQLDEFVRLNAKLKERSRFVLDLTKEFRLISFNAALKSTKLGAEGLSLGVIAQHLGESSTRVAAIVNGLVVRIDAVSSKLRSVVFNLAGSRLQVETIVAFCHELLTELSNEGAQLTRETLSSRRRMIECLKEAFSETNALTIQTLTELEAELYGLGTNSEDLRKAILTLQVTRVGGVVEASRLKGDDAFSVIFETVSSHIEDTRKELVELNQIVDRLGSLAGRAPVVARAVNDSVRSMDREMRRLATVRVESAAAAQPGQAAELQLATT